jgi:predicted dienelactone hydrolase
MLAGSAVARCPAGADLESFGAPGRFGVGVRTLTLVDSERPTKAWGGQAARSARTLTTEVWYPTAGDPAAAPVRDAPLAHRGPFPFVVNSHGFSDLRIGEAYYAIALASRGYVVASPDFPLTHLGTPGGPDLSDVYNQVGDVAFVIDQLLALSRTRGSWLAGGIQRHRIGASGLSLGGLTTLLVTYHPTLRDHRIRAAVALAPAACYLAEDFYRAARPPLLLIGGDEDLITPLATNAARAFERSRSPRRLLTLAHATHTAFAGLIRTPSTTSYDSLGCLLVEQITQEQVDAAIAPFGAEGAALVDTNGCALPCLTEAPSTPPMQALRQQAITQAAVVGFFESTFRRSRAARCFLKSGLAGEPDVHLDSAPARSLKAR